MTIYKIKIDKNNCVHDVWENDWYTCPNCGESLFFLEEDEE